MPRRYACTGMERGRRRPAARAARAPPAARRRPGRPGSATRDPETHVRERERLDELQRTAAHGPRSPPCCTRRGSVRPCTALMVLIGAPRSCMYGTRRHPVAADLSYECCGRPPPTVQERRFSNLAVVSTSTSPRAVAGTRLTCATRLLRRQGGGGRGPQPSAGHRSADPDSD